MCTWLGGLFVPVPDLFRVVAYSSHHAIAVHFEVIVINS